MVGFTRALTVEINTNLTVAFTEWTLALFDANNVIFIDIYVSIAN